MGTHRTRRRPAWLAVATLALALGLAGCSDDGEPTDGDAPATSSTTARAEDAPETDEDQVEGAAVPGFNDLQTCELAGGVATATGELENIGDVTADFEIEIAFLDGATAEQLGTGTTSIDSLDAGGIGAWTVTIEGLDGTEVTCETVTMEGTPVG